MAYIHQIRELDFENSFSEPGYRTSTQSKIAVGAVVAVFVNFCSFHCEGCWNPETWSRKPELYTTDEDVAKEIIKSLKKINLNPPLGLSILGGDPILPQNIKSTVNILKIVLNEFPDLVIGVWTGYTWEAIQKRLQKNTDDSKYLIYLLNHIDVLIDGPFILKLKIKNKRYGSSNQRVINVPKSNATKSIVLTNSYLAETTVE